MSEQIPPSLEGVESQGWDELARTATQVDAESAGQDDIRTAPGYDGTGLDDGIQ